MRDTCALGVRLLLVCLAAVPLFAGELPPGFRLEPVLAGLTEPSSIAAAPDGRLLITERTTGSLRAVYLGELQASPLCTVAVNATGEGGLLGVAVHPNFLRNGWVYLYYTDLGTGKNRVSRFTVGTASCSTPTVILSDLGAGAGFLRNGGGLGFGPDGKLYVATGDVENPANGQNGTALQAKVLRVNDDGTVPGDNPTGGSLVWASGVRDGRDVGVGSNGKVYVGDRGSDVDSAHDEIGVAPAGGNLGWAAVTGSDGPGGFDDPLVAWLPTAGTGGLAVYAGQSYPDADSDTVDNDDDRYGPNRAAGVARFDDDGDGVCVGSTSINLACTTNANCPPRPGGEPAYCEKRDEPDEWCPGGTPAGDDDCDALGGSGVDEPDESFLNSLFLAAGDDIVRTVPTGAGLDQLASSATFLDGSAAGDCPTSWTDVATGNDGALYAVATNGGGGAGALYRIVHDETPGPREVSAPGSHFPLRVEKGANPNEVVLYWEDLRADASQPRNSGTTLLPPEREYSVWRGTLGSYYTHGTAPVVGLEAIAGTAVNDAVRKTTVSSTASAEYFLVSARSANYQGTLGKRSSGVPRPGYANPEVCDTTGYFKSPNWFLFTCGFDFTLLDENGQTRSLYDLRGKVVVMDFSAIWCVPCGWQANTIENVNVDYKDRGVEFLTVLMDEEINGVDWDGRPTVAECRNWGDRPGSFPDHTFDCVADSEQPGQVAWPKYIVNGSIPRMVVFDTGMRVAYSLAGWSDPAFPPDEAEAALRAKLDELVGATQSCLH